jgi:hypothetical protein
MDDSVPHHLKALGSAVSFDIGIFFSQLQREETNMFFSSKSSSKSSVAHSCTSFLPNEAFFAINQSEAIARNMSVN